MEGESAQGDARVADARVADAGVSVARITDTGYSRREVRVASMANAGTADAGFASHRCYKREARGLRLSQGMRMRTRG